VKKLSISVLVLALGFAFSTGLMAKGISKGDYQAGNRRVGTDYKSAKALCATFEGNTNDICMAKAQGKKNIALAENQARYQPNPMAKFRVRMARATAAYAVASEGCDERAGKAKDICVKEAKAMSAKAKADARAQIETSDGNAAANE
jgi:hypothetical protein